MSATEIKFRIIQQTMHLKFSGIPAPTAGGYPEWANVQNKPLTFPPSEHQHAYSSLSGIPSTFTPSAHQHAYSSLSEIPSTFTPSAHQHAYSSLSEIPSTFPPSAHSQDWSTITGKPTEFGQITYDKVVTAGDYASLKDALESGTYKTVFIPDGTYLVTDNEARPLVVHANIKKIVGESRDGTIIDANSLSSITDVLYCHTTLEVQSITIKNVTAGAKGFSGQSTNLYGTVYTHFVDCVATGFGDYAVGFAYAKCTNCIVYGVNTACIGFRYCDYLTNCVVDTTSYIAFGDCIFLVGCKANGAYFCFYSCDFVFNCYARIGTLTYYGCTRLYGCTTHSCITGYASCSTVIGCRSFADTTGFDTCSGVIEPIIQGTGTPFANGTVKLNLSDGATGTFTTVDGKNVTVTNGIITGIN